MSSIASQRTRPKSALHSLIWKEVHQLKLVFAALILLGTVLQCLLSVYIGNWPNGLSRNSEFMSVALIGTFSVLFATACGATLFATEKESNTFQNLQLLPVTSRQVVNGKVLAAFVLCILFFAAATLVAWVSLQISGVDSRQPWLMPFVLTFGLGTVEFFVWAWLCSVLMSRPINAVIVSILLASLTIQLAIYWTREEHLDFATVDPYVLAWKYRLILASVVLLNAWLKSQSWLSNENKTVSASNPVSSGMDWLARLVTWLPRRAAKLAGEKIPQLYRLTWQAVRQSWKGLVLAALSTVALGISMMLLNVQMLFLSVPLILASGGLAGMCAFSADQQIQRGNFLATRGISANQIWLSRVLPWMLGIVTFFAGCYFLFLAVASQIPQLQFSELARTFSFGRLIFDPSQLVGGFNGYLIGQLTLWTTVGFLFCFSAGQFISLVIRSRILAFIVTVFVCLPLAVWLILMLLGGVPVWWSVLPLMAVFLFGGRLALNANLNESPFSKRVIVPTILVVASIGALISAVIYHRANEIPETTVFFRREAVSVDQAMLDEIDTRFNIALSKVKRSDELPDSITNQYPVALMNLITSQSRFLDEYWRIRQGPNASILWNANSRNRNKLSPNDVKELAHKFIDDNQAATEELWEAIQFAWNNQEVLLALEPAPSYAKSNRNPLSLRSSSVYEILELGIVRAIHENRPELAWKNLKAKTQFAKMASATSANRAHWYADFLSYFEWWALCENQKPELLREAIQVVLKDLVPFFEQRVLEYQYRGLISQANKHNMRLSTNALSLEEVYFKLLEIPALLLCEQTRTRRLIDLHCASEIRKKTSPRDWILPDVENGEPAGKFFIRYNRRQRRDPVVGQGSRLRRFCTTTVLPKIDRDEHYFRALTLPPEFPANQLRDRQSDLDEMYLEQRQMVALQMHLLLHKLEHGVLPKNLDDYIALVHIDYSVANIFYYPEGIKQQLNTKFRGSFAPSTPFLSNLPAVSISTREYKIVRLPSVFGLRPWGQNRGTFRRYNFEEAHLTSLKGDYEKSSTSADRVLFYEPPARAIRLSN